MSPKHTQEEAVTNAGLSDEEFKKEFPSIDLAYPIALQSYDIALKRFDAIELRVHNLLIFASSVTLALPTVAKLSNPNLKVDSIFFAAALFFYFVSIALGTYVRLSGTLEFIEPSKLHSEYLSLNEQRFKSDIIYYAGEHFQNNKTAINSKGFWANIVAFLLLLEGCSFAVWFWQSP